MGVDDANDTGVLCDSASKDVNEWVRQGPIKLCVQTLSCDGCTQIDLGTVILTCPAASVYEAVPPEAALEAALEAAREAALQTGLEQHLFYQ